jgi:hypothetical protein
VDSQIAGDLGDRALGLKDEPNAAIEQLLGVLAWSWHRVGDLPSSRTESWVRGLRETRPGSQIQCSGKVAGLGGTEFEITVTAPGTASVECTNPAGNVAPGQDTAVTVAGSSGPLATPNNGQYVFTLMSTAPTVPNTPTCPNRRWTASVVDVAFGDATLTLTEDGTVSDTITVPVS